MQIARFPSFASIALSGFVSTASAATLFSNLGQPGSGAAVLIATTSQRVATEFLTGAGASTLAGLTMRVLNNGLQSYTYNAYLFSDSSGAPGGLLETFAGVDNVVGASQIKNATFSHTGISLAADTRYWIALGVAQGQILSPPPSTVFLLTASNVADPDSVFTVASPPYLHTSTNSGLSWTNTLVGANGRFAIEGTLVPEPSRTALVLAGLVALVLGRRARWE